MTVIDTAAIRAWLEHQQQRRNLISIEVREQQLDETILSLCDEIDRLREQSGTEDGGEELCAFRYLCERGHDLDSAEPLTTCPEPCGAPLVRTLDSGTGSDGSARNRWRTEDARKRWGWPTETPDEPDGNGSTEADR